MRPTLLLIALCFAPLLAAAQDVYRCVGPGGQVVFQQAACPAGKGGPIEVRQANVVEGNPAGESQVRAQAERSQTVRSAQARGQVMQGMTTSEMQQVMGHARVVNTDSGTGGVRQQHVYRGADGTRYVYTENGVVTSMQSRPRY